MRALSSRPPSFLSTFGLLPLLLALPCWLSTAVAAPPQVSSIGPATIYLQCMMGCEKHNPKTVCAAYCERLATTSPPPIAVTPGSLVVLTFGDSIMWGQGIPEGQKFADTATNWLQSAYQGLHNVVRFPTPTRAHSGAHIALPASSDGPDTAPGEVPSHQPSVALQVDLTVADLQQAGIPVESVVLVLVDGCINDVGVFSILWPTNSTADIRQWTQQQCSQMTALLSRILSTFPRSAVVVTGYYPIITPLTDTAALAQYFALLGAKAGGPNGALAAAGAVAVSKDQMAANSTAFANTALSTLAGAVSAANQANQRLSPGASTAVALAWPGFSDSNGYAAPNTFLWKLDDFAAEEAAGPTTLFMPPPDTPNYVAWARAQWCLWNADPDPSCVVASVGHPNMAGVSVYQNAIIWQLQTALNAKLRLPAPPPPQPTLSLFISSGSDNNGPTVRLSPVGAPTKLTNWLVVSAYNSLTRAPVQAMVTISPDVPQQVAEGGGSTFNKFYYLCEKKVLPPNQKGVGGSLISTCPVTVYAPNFPPAYFAAKAQ